MGRYDWIIENKPTTEPAFAVGDFVRCDSGASGRVQSRRNGSVPMSILDREYEDGRTANDDTGMVFTGPTFARDEYGFYLIKIHSTAGTSNLQFWHEAALLGE